MDYTAARQAWPGLAFPTTMKTGHAPGERRKIEVIEETHWLFRKAAWHLSRAQPSRPKEFCLFYLLFSVAAQWFQCWVSVLMCLGLWTITGDLAGSDWCPVEVDRLVLDVK